MQESPTDTTSVNIPSDTSGGVAESNNPSGAVEGVLQEVPTPLGGCDFPQQGVVLPATGGVAGSTNRTQRNSKELPPGGDSLRSTPTEPTLDLSDIPPAARGAPPSSLVAGYIDDVVALTGSRPPSSWIGAAGKAIKRAEAEGFTSDEIALALGDRARRNGNPGGLLNALMDLRRDLHTSGAGR